MSSGPIVAYIDGGSRGNPGVAGYGVRIEAGDGSVIEELTGAIGIATNNVAEYRGLLAALTWLDHNGCRDATIRSDSELLTRQMTGQFKVRHPGLKPLHAEATAIVRRLGRVRFEHVRRSANVEADRLANAAMDSAAAGGRAPVPRAAPASIAVDAGRGGNVIGIGIDIESIARVGRLLERYGPRFVERVFTAEEAAYSLRRARPAQHLAARFAAKEAAMKALGTGHSRGVVWRGIEVVREAGPPRLRFHGAAARHFDVIGATHALLTISHSGDFALAHVMFFGR